MLARGQRIHGYEVLEAVGQGGFGQVYKAIRLSDGATVALKVLSDPANHDALKRFQREVRQLAALRSPRIVSVLSAHLNASPPFYVMPFAAGGTLAPFAGKLTDAEVRSVLRSLTEALVVVHQCGHHLDLKPDNLLLDEVGNPALADFGLGNRVGCTIAFSCSGGGTPGFMAPEVARQAWPLDGRAADIFSLGATIFNLLTGISPNLVREPLHLALVHARPTTSPDLVRLVEEACQTQPSRRPTAAQLLARTATIRPTPLRPPSSSDWRWLQAVAAGLLVVGGLSVLFAKR